MDLLRVRERENFITTLSMKVHGTVSGIYKHSVNVNFIRLFVYGKLNLFVVKSRAEMSWTR